jgi:hypothetical protein
MMIDGGSQAAKATSGRRPQRRSSNGPQASSIHPPDPLSTAIRIRSDLWPRIRLTIDLSIGMPDQATPDPRLPTAWQGFQPDFVHVIATWWLSAHEVSRSVTVSESPMLQHCS